MNPWNRPFIHIHTKVGRFYSGPSSEKYGVSRNPFSSFCVIFCVNQPTHKQTNTDIGWKRNLLGKGNNIYNMNVT